MSVANRLTISGMPRAVYCPASEVIPHAADRREAHAATRGRVLHQYLRDVILLGREEALRRSPSEHYLACEILEIDRLPASEPDLYIPEIAIAYDWENDTAREINRGIDSRDYGPLSATEIAGRADVASVSIVNGRRYVIVYDYKSGHSWLGSPARSIQLGMYALALARLWDCEGAFVAFIRLRADGTPFYDQAELDFTALLALAALVKRTMLRIAELRASPPKTWSEPDLTIGDWCKYCPTKRQCPEWNAEASAMIQAFPGSEKDALLLGAAGKAREVPAESPRIEIGPDNARRFYFRRLILTWMFDELDAAMKLYAEDNPIELGDGRIWGPVEQDRESFKLERGIAVLGARFGPDLAEMSVKSVPELTKASMERGAKVYIEQHPELQLKATPLVRDMVDALRKGGAAMVKTEVRWYAHKPKQLESDSGEES